MRCAHPLGGKLCVKPAEGGLLEKNVRTRASVFIPILLALLWGRLAYAQSADRLFEAGRKAFQDGMYVMAGRNLRKLVDEYPDSPLADDAEYLGGVADFYLEEFRSCVATLEGYARKYPRSENNRRVSYWLGSAYFHLLDFQKAHEQLRRQVDRYPDEQPYHDHALLLKGMVEENLSDWAAARESYDRLLGRDSASELWPEALYRSGGLYLRSGDYAEALTRFRRLLVEFPGSTYAAQAVFFIGECNFFLARYAEAERSFRSVLASEPSAEQWQTSLYRLASILAEQGRNREVLEICAELGSRFPASRYAGALSRLEADALFDLKRYGEAYDAYGRALGAAADAGDRQVIYYNMGLSAFLGGDVRRCLEPLEKALQGSPEISQQSLFRLSAALAQLGSTPQAVERYEEFLRRYPASRQREEAARMLAALYYDGGNWDRATRLYTELITRYPDSAYQDEYLFKRGSSHLQMGDSAEALKDFFALNRRWRQSPYLAESSYNIGYIYSQRGEYTRASPFFQDVLSTDPSPELTGRAVLAAGVCAFNAGEYEEAIRWFEKNISSSGSRNDGAGGRSAGGGTGRSAWEGESWFYLGRTNYKLEALDTAAGGFARAAELLAGTSQGEEALFWQGLCEFRLQRYDSARETFMALAERYPKGQRVAESYYRAGVCASQANGYAESVAFFDKALQVAGSQPSEYSDRLKQEILYQKGFSLLQAGERGKAIAVFETLGREFPEGTLASEAFFKVAEEDYRAGRYGSAARSFLAVRERFPATPAAASALYWAGMSAARDGDRRAALSHLIDHLEESSGRRNAGGLDELAMKEIRGLLQEIAAAGAAEEGREFEAFYRRVDRSPALDPAFKNRVRFEYARYVFSSDPDRALQILQEVRAEDPPQPLAGEVGFLIGEYYRVTGDLDRALDIFTGIVAVNSEQPGAASQMGIARILEARGLNREAAEEYLKVHFLYPDLAELAAEGLYRAGRLYWAEGRRDTAEQLFEKLASEYPDSPWLKELGSQNP